MSDATAAAIRTLLDAVEQLERAEARRDRAVEALQQEVDALRRQLAEAGASAGRVPLEKAAQLLGCGPDHALRLAKQGLLDLADMRRRGAPKARWTIGEKSLSTLIATRRAVAAGAADAAPKTPSARSGRGEHR